MTTIQTGSKEEDDLSVWLENYMV